MKNSYLEFVELDDYLAHLRSLAERGNATPTTRCEITSIGGKPNKHGIAGVAYYAALTYHHADYIATCAIPLLNTTNFHLQTDRDAMRAKLHENFDKVIAMLRARGVEVTRGKRTLTTPNYLSEGG
jgi:hypothetical protein